jgi:hypothetical protein
MYLSIIALLCCAVAMGGNTSLPQEQANPQEIRSENLRKLQEAVRRNPPARYRQVVLERKAARRKLQQQSYAAILYDTVQHDGVSALIAYIKMNVLAEFSLDHGFLFWIIPPDPTLNVPGVQFEEDLSFPADPWERE